MSTCVGLCAQRGGVSAQSAWQRAKLQDQHPAFFRCASQAAPAAAGRGSRGAQPRHHPQACPARLLLAMGGAALGAAPGSLGGGRGRGIAAAANRAAPGEEPRRGKKKVRRKVRGSLGEDWPGQGPWGSVLGRSGAGRFAPIPAPFAAPAQLPKKGESRAVLRARRNPLSQNIRVEGFLQIVQPS